MPIVRMTEFARPLSNADLDEYERAWTVVFPPDYRAFLLRHNGGRPEPESFPLPGGDASLINRFYSISEDKRDDIGTKTKKLMNDHVLPGTVVVAVDAGGNHLCLGVEDHNRGKVYFVDHEGMDGDTVEDRSAEIAGSWTEFEESIGSE